MEALDRIADRRHELVAQRLAVLRQALDLPEPYARPPEERRPDEAEQPDDDRGRREPRRRVVPAIREPCMVEEPWLRRGGLPLRSDVREALRRAGRGRRVVADQRAVCSLRLVDVIRGQECRSGGAQVRGRAIGAVHRAAETSGKERENEGRPQVSSRRVIRRPRAEN